jgi:hypothetical protein
LPAGRSSSATARRPALVHHAAAENQRRRLARGRRNRCRRGGKPKLAARHRVAREIEHLDPRSLFADRGAQRLRDARLREPLGRALEAYAVPRVRVDSVTRSQLRQLARAEHAARSRRGREPERLFRRERGERRQGLGHVRRQDAVPVHRDARDCHRRRHHHCVTLFTCWYISSAAFTTLELAS